MYSHTHHHVTVTPVHLQAVMGLKQKQRQSLNDIHHEFLSLVNCKEISVQSSLCIYWPQRPLLFCYPASTFASFS